LTELINNIKSCKTIEQAKKYLYYKIEFDEDIEKALNFCIFYHEGQYRKSGEDYAVHPILVSYMIMPFILYWFRILLPILAVIKR